LRNRSVNFRVCQADAKRLAGGEVNLATGILSGLAPLHEMPRDLLKEEALEGRLAWLRSKAASTRPLPRNFSLNWARSTCVERPQDELGQIDPPCGRAHGTTRIVTVVGELLAKLGFRAMRFHPASRKTRWVPSPPTKREKHLPDAIAG
jgi:hypothetical protein